MFPQLTAFFDWIQANVINGFFGPAFTYVSNFFIGMKPLLDVFGWLFGLFTVMA